MDHQLTSQHVMPLSERLVQKCLRRPMNKADTFLTTTRVEFKGELLRIYTYLGWNTRDDSSLAAVEAVAIVAFNSTGGCFGVEFLSL